MIYHLDEHVSERLTETAEDRDLDVVSIDRLGLQGLDDVSNLLWAARSARVLVTYDVRDYTLLHRAWHVWSHAWVIDNPPRHAGIALIHSSKHAGIDEIVEALIQLSEIVDIPENRLLSWDYPEGWTEIV
jgi:Domain of unknown function (DUF5615)